MGSTIEPGMALCQSRYRNQVRPEDRIASVLIAKAIVEQAESWVASWTVDEVGAVAGGLCSRETDWCDGCLATLQVSRMSTGGFFHIDFREHPALGIAVTTLDCRIGEDRLQTTTTGDRSPWLALSINTEAVAGVNFRDANLLYETCIAGRVGQNRALVV